MGRDNVYAIWPTIDHRFRAPLGGIWQYCKCVCGKMVCLKNLTVPCGIELICRHLHFSSLPVTPHNAHTCTRPPLLTAHLGWHKQDVTTLPLPPPALSDIMVYHHVHLIDFCTGDHPCPFSRFWDYAHCLKTLQKERQAKTMIETFMLGSLGR